MFCSKCGYKLKSGETTCSNCGTPVSNAEVCGGFWGLVGEGKNPENTSSEEKTDLLNNSASSNSMNSPVTNSVNPSPSKGGFAINSNDRGDVNSINTIPQKNNNSSPAIQDKKNGLTVASIVISIILFCICILLALNLHFVKSEMADMEKTYDSKFSKIEDSNSRNSEIEDFSEKIDSISETLDELDERINEVEKNKIESENKTSNTTSGGSSKYKGIEDQDSKDEIEEFIEENISEKTDAIQKDIDDIKQEINEIKAKIKD